MPFCVFIVMRYIIKKILQENKNTSIYLKIDSSKIGNTIKKALDTDVEWDNIDNEIDDLSERYALDKEYVKFIVFKYIVDEDGDPEEDMYMVDWLYKITYPLDFIKDSGYYEKFLNPNELRDLVEIDENNYKLEVDGWEEFKDWFDDIDLAYRILNEDWAELYDSWDIGIEEIFDILDEKGIKTIKDYILENVDMIEVVDDMNLDSIIDETGNIDVNKHSNTIGMFNQSEILDIIRNGEFESKDDLIHSLRNAYNNAYNSAAEDEIFMSLKNDIERFLGAEGTWEGKNLVFNVSKKIINKCTEEFFLDSHNNPISYHGSFMYMMSDYFREYASSRDKLKTPDMNYFYPDHRMVSKNFNEILLDYL